MVSHAEVLNLLHREANMSGYGYGLECPSCDGSGLIGGFEGQRSAFGAVNDMKLTKAEREAYKKKLKAVLGKDDKPRVMSKEKRIAAMQAYIQRGGPKEKKAHAKKYSAEEVLALIEEAKRD